MAFTYTEILAMALAPRAQKGLVVGAHRASNEHVGTEEPNGLKLNLCDQNSMENNIDQVILCEVINSLMHDAIVYCLPEIEA